MSKRKRPAKRNRAGRKRNNHVSVANTPLGGDHGTGTPAAMAGKHLVPVLNDEGKNPNNMGQMRTVSVIAGLKLTVRQYRAAEAIQCAYEALDKGKGLPPLKVRVDSSPRPDVAITSQIEVQSRVNQVMKAVRWRDRPIVLYVCVKNSSVKDIIAKGVNSTRIYNRLRENLDLVADHLDATKGWRNNG